MEGPRFFLPPTQILADEVRLVGDDFTHLTRVLRLGVGDWFCVLDGQGMRLSVQLTEINRREGRGRIDARAPALGELPVKLTLAAAVIKGERFEWLIQKATELGVSRLVPLLTERTVVRLDAERGQGKLARWQAIAREAAEQSERALLPEILAPVPLDHWLAQRPPESLLACLERAEAPLLSAALGTLGLSKSLTLLVGPEGGVSPGEQQRLLACDALPVSLGGRILRAETAGVAALAIAAQWAEARTPD